MPKILIKEFDKTSSGTPGNYANYAVLIAGYQQTSYSDTELDKKLDKTHEENRKNLVDANGAYEFKSAGDFEKTIGITEIEKTVEKTVGDSTSTVVEGPHYGNRMAYELLNMGYTVIYKVINSIDEMSDSEFWAPFYDKASYDFRFISHGLLETDCDDIQYKALKTRLAAITQDVAKLIEIKENAKTAYETEKGTEAWIALPETADDDAKDKGEGDPKSKTVIYMRAYNKSSYPGFLKDVANNKKYSYAEAVDNLTPTNSTKNETAPAVVAQQSLIDLHDTEHVTPGTINKINGLIAKLASYRTDKEGNVLNDGRGDCIALIELAESCYTNNTTSKTRPETLIAQGIKEMSSEIGEEGAYCALTVPSVYYNMSGEIKKFPGSFHYLACFMSSLSSGFAEWYAAAGYTRGVSSYVIDHTAVKLGEIAINALEPRNLVDDENKVQPPFACNVIANFRGSYYLWGNRTAHKLGAAAGGNDLVAHHFLNIRQLCTTLKKQLYVACRRFTFDPNSDTLWFNFVNAITPTLDLMKADQGIRDYKVIKVFTDKKATMKAKIRIIPIEAVEDFDIEVSLEDSFGGVSVNAN